MMFTRFPAILVTIFLFGILARANEELDQPIEVSPLDSNYDFNVTFEDDYPGISFWGDDRAYTEGLRFSYQSAQAELPFWSRPFFEGLQLVHGNSEFNVGYAIGQQMYTPEDLGTSTVITNDEPYAGYLFLETSAHLRNENVLHSLVVELGMVGPPSLAAQTQINFHRIFGFDPVNGWANQLHTEPTLTLFYQQKISLLQLRGENNQLIFDFTPSFEGAVGNLYDYAGVGAQLRFGYHLTDDFGPTVLTPVGTDKFVAGGSPSFFEAYLFASAEGRYMARNLFLDGNTFVASNHIQKLPFVRDFDFGFLVRVGCLKATWRQIGRGEEYTPESGPHAFASIVVSYTQRL